MKIIRIHSCLRTDDEGRYFEECPYVVRIFEEWRCAYITGQFLVPVEGIPPWCLLDDEKETGYPCSKDGIIYPCGE